MPIKRMLEGRNFDPKAAAVLVEAFNGVVADLDLQTAADREMAAEIVIELAADRTLVDAAELRDDAIGLMRGAHAATMIALSNTGMQPALDEGPPL